MYVWKTLIASQKFRFRLFSDNQGPVTRGNFSCNLQRNAVAKQVEDEIARITPPLRNLSRDEKIALRVAGQVDSSSSFFAFIASV